MKTIEMKTNNENKEKERLRMVFDLKAFISIFVKNANIERCVTIMQEMELNEEEKNRLGSDVEYELNISKKYRLFEILREEYGYKKDHAIQVVKDMEIQDIIKLIDCLDYYKSTIDVTGINIVQSFDSLSREQILDFTVEFDSFLNLNWQISKKDLEMEVCNLYKQKGEYTKVKLINDLLNNKIAILNSKNEKKSKADDIYHGFKAYYEGIRDLKDEKIFNWIQILEKEMKDYNISKIDIITFWINQPEIYMELLRKHQLMEKNSGKLELIVEMMNQQEKWEYEWDNRAAIWRGNESELKMGAKHQDRLLEKDVEKIQLAFDLPNSFINSIRYRKSEIAKYVYLLNAAIKADVIDVMPFELALDDVIKNRTLADEYTQLYGMAEIMRRDLGVSLIDAVDSLLDSEQCMGIMMHQYEIETEQKIRIEQRKLEELAARKRQIEERVEKQKAQYQEWEQARQKKYNTSSSEYRQVLGKNGIMYHVYTDRITTNYGTTVFEPVYDQYGVRIQTLL